MTITITDLRTGIKDALERIGGLYATATEPAQVRLPAAWPLLERYDESTDFDGHCTYTFSVRVLVGVGDLVRAQTALDAYMSRQGANSVRAALLVDPSLGLGSDVRVLAWRLMQRPEMVDTSGGKSLSQIGEVDISAP